MPLQHRIWQRWPILWGSRACRGPVPWEVLCPPLLPSCCHLSFHPALEFSAFRCVATSALLWSENQISRLVRPACKVRGKKAQRRGLQQGFSNGPPRPESLKHLFTAQSPDPLHQNLWGRLWNL